MDLREVQSAKLLPPPRPCQRRPFKLSDRDLGAPF